MAFEGKVYDWAGLARRSDLRESPPELIARLYADAGMDGVHKLRGVFSLALLDRRRDRFYLLRDRLGAVPIYYAEGPRTIAFGSTIASVLAASVIRPEIDIAALPYLAFGVRPAPGTIFKGVVTLAPGHYLEVGIDARAVRQYWDVPFPDASAGRQPERRYAEELGALLAETVSLYAQDDGGPAALLLSGGLDSSLLAGLASEVGPLRTYAIAFRDPGHEMHDESEFARSVARRVGSRHAEFDYRSAHVNAYFLETLRHSECPSYPGEPRSMIPFYLLHRRMSQDGIKVVLTGLGADEILGGYPHHQFEKVRRSIGDRPDRPRRDRLYQRVLGWQGEGPGYFDRIHQEIRATYGHDLAVLMWIRGFAFIRENLRSFFSDAVVAAIGHDGLSGGLHLDLDPATYARFDPFDQSLYLDIKTRLADFGLMEEYKVSTAVGLEARYPYLDHRVVEYAATIPPCAKMPGLRPKSVLHQISRRFLPPSFFHREKRGFTAPFEREVLVGPRSFLVNELLSPGALRRAGYLRPAFVSALLARYPVEPDPMIRSAISFMLERALIIQGVHHLFVRKAGWEPRVAALLTGVRERLLQLPLESELRSPNGWTSD